MLLATAGVAIASGVSQRLSNSSQASNPAQQDDARFQNFRSSYQANGGTGGINEARAAYNALPASAKAAFD